MNDVAGLSGWRWLFIFDGVITLPMAVWGYIALPDLPSNTRVFWLKPHEKKLARERMRKAGKALEEPITLKGVKRVLSRWHFWVYTAYYTYVSPRLPYLFPLPESSGGCPVKTRS
jgi:ACS family pantothenate transporter-like MFS transporter